MALRESLPPPGFLLGLAPGVVELHQPLQGLGSANQRLGRDLGRTLLQALIGLDQKRLGVRMPLLTQECAAEQ